jgi:transcriptional regulator with XRE-family HTH domain
MENNNHNVFGEGLRRLRTEKGLTQTELGDKAGLSTRMIVHYEKHVKRPPADKIAALAKTLNVSIDALVRGQNPPTEVSVDKGFARKLEKAKKLPLQDQKFLSTMIDSLLRKNDLHIKRPKKGRIASNITRGHK